MIRPSSVRLLLAITLAATLAPTAALAQPGWGGRGYGGGFGGGWGGAGNASRTAAPRDDREGRVDAERFVADGALAALGHGHVTVRSAAGSTADGREQATFEAAVIDQLAKGGYDTVTPDAIGGQIVEVTITRDMLVPEEAKRNPISGAMEAGVSNRGSMMAVELQYDATKPRAALISTGIEIRIRDRASGASLYEARARLASREGDAHWTDTAIATRLAAALFDHFPSNRPGNR